MTHLRIRCALLAMLAIHAAASAQAPASEPEVRAPPPPLIEPSNALEGRALVDALRKGGFVLYMRHAKQGRYTEACTETNLTAEGEAQARKVASGLRELRVPIGSVRSSRLCRALDTARLLEAGSVETTPDLNPGTRVDTDIHVARMKLLAQTPKPGTNTILVSHAQNSAREEERMLLELAEVAVYRPDGKGGTVPVARIRMDDWEALPR